MRSENEQLREILRRTELVKERRGIRARLRASAAGVLACALLLCAVGASLPVLPAAQAGTGMQRYGSLLLFAPYMGYVVVGVLAFALGISVTLLCLFYRRLHEKDRVRDES